jgi:uncharacterized membrane protein
MRLSGVGQVLFGVSLAAIGALSIGWHDFAPTWELLPKWIAWRSALVIPCGAMLLAGGVALLIPRAARPAALALAALLLLRLLLLHVPRIAIHPLVEGVYESMSENLIYIAGAWTIFSMLPSEDESRANFGNVRAGQVLFALALPAIGLSHLVYLNMTAPLIPSWLPFHVPLAYFTGVAWIAAAAGILFGVLPRLAATLTAVMASLFTLIIWGPTVIAAPTNVSDWSEICASTAITGAAWAVAESYRGGSWRLAKKR